MEETLIFFKPDCLNRELVHVIYEEFIFPNNFTVMSVKPITVTRKLILAHYEKNLVGCSQDVIERVVKFYEGKSILLMILKKEHAIFDMRTMLGNSDPSCSEPNTIRGKYGDDSYESADKEKRSCRNLVHASDSKEEYLRERKIWFGY